MSTQNVISDLVQTLEDGRQGYADAAKKLAQDGNTTVAQTFDRYAEERATFSSQLRSAAAQKGLNIDENGSLAGAMHRGWISVKDTLTGDDADAIVNAALKGEEHAVDEFEKALADDELPLELAPTVADQLNSIRSACSELQSLTR